MPGHVFLDASKYLTIHNTARDGDAEGKRQLHNNRICAYLRETFPVAYFRIFCKITNQIPFFPTSSIEKRHAAFFCLFWWIELSQFCETDILTTNFRAYRVVFLLFISLWPSVFSFLFTHIRHSVHTWCFCATTWNWNQMDITVNHQHRFCAIPYKKRWGHQQKKINKNVKHQLVRDDADREPLNAKRRKLIPAYKNQSIFIAEPSWKWKVQF